MDDCRIHLPLPCQPVLFAHSGLCGRRTLEIDRIRKYLVDNGFQPVESWEQAEILLFYGCGFNRDNEEASLAKLRSLAPNYAHIFLLGGISEIIAKDEIENRIGRRVEVISLKHAEALDPFFAHRLKFDQSRPSHFSHFRQNHWSIQVGRGCASNCSYCGDKKIVGPLRSLSLEAILRSFREGLARGFVRFDLVGDDVGAWGIDIGSHVGLLLEKLTGIDEEFSLSLQEVNIGHIARHIRHFESALASGKIDFLALAFQHVNDRMLHLMNRGYAGKDVRVLSELLHQYQVRVHFHAIVGFPMESRDEFEENLRFISEQQFSSGSCFIYQDRSYAAASQFDGKVSTKDMLQRVEYAEKVLNAHGYSVNRHYADDFIPTSSSELPDILRLERKTEELPVFSKAMDWLRDKPRPDFGPHGVIRKFSRIILEQTSICPNKCIFCKFHGKVKPGIMPIGGLEKILKTLPVSDALVEVSGNGEPLVLDDLPDRVRLIKYSWPKCRINVLTSLSVPRDRAYFTRLLRAGVDTVMVSCYGHDSSDYMYLHGRDAFTCVCCNIETLANVATQFDVSVQVHSLHDTDSIFHVKDAESKRSHFERYLRLHNVATISKRVYSGQGELRIAEVEPFPVSLPCSVTWGNRANELMVTWEGAVQPCCFMYRPEHALGNLFSDSLDSIYTSERYTFFSLRHWEKNVAGLPVCDECDQPGHAPSAAEVSRLAAWEGRRLAGKEVLFWGCGQAYQAYKIFFGQTKPKAILLDTHGPRPSEVDGIRVARPGDVLPSEGSLPIVIFAYPQHRQAIVRSLHRFVSGSSSPELVFCPNF